MKLWRKFNWINWSTYHQGIRGPSVCGATNQHSTALSHYPISIKSPAEKKNRFRFWWPRFDPTPSPSPPSSPVSSSPSPCQCPPCWNIPLDSYCIYMPSFSLGVFQVELWIIHTGMHILERREIANAYGDRGGELKPDWLIISLIFIFTSCQTLLKDWLFWSETEVWYAILSHVNRKGHKPSKGCNLCFLCVLYINSAFPDFLRWYFVFKSVKAANPHRCCV